ncbi:hypothetical protein GEMRC1_013478 [Eukaryota sp. GEM-RC1]
MFPSLSILILVVVCLASEPASRSQHALNTFAVSIKPLPPIVNPSQRIVLNAQFSGGFRSIEWTSEPDVLTSLNLLSRANRRALVLRPDSLPSSQTVTFTLTVTSTTGTVATASIDLTAPSRPIPGVLDIYPSSGVGLTDYFNITHETDTEGVSYQ